MASKATPLAFHHMGLLTGQPELAGKMLIDLGYSLGESIFDPEQNVTLRMCNHLNGGSAIELVTPHPDNIGLNRLLRRKDDYIYHLCFTTTDITQGLNTLDQESLGHIVEIMPPKPAVLFDGAKVAFYAVPGLGLIELLEQK